MLHGLSARSPSRKFLKRSGKSVLSECQVNRLPLSLTISHPAWRARRSPLALTMVESKVELLPALLLTTEFFGGQEWAEITRVSNRLKSISSVKERG
jgi:hypothetical protein